MMHRIDDLCKQDEEIEIQSDMHEHNFWSIFLYFSGLSETMLARILSMDSATETRGSAPESSTDPAMEEDRESSCYR